MRATGIVVLVLTVVLPNLTLGAPLTKWFKTDNTTYYIESDHKFTWQQSYAECKHRNLNLLTIKQFNADDLLNEYLKQMYDPIPDFWLKSDYSPDLNNLLTTKTDGLVQIKLEESDIIDIVVADDPANCVLTKDGTTKACDIVHGFICHTNNDENCPKNIQNIILKFD
ncbi:uncharacterized protein LOC142227001 [Haematobia irritans]|uniref:uncharacterized protein LOC142227001 n=1 Tax=Haematobia irritans TaxID=7368 RepID=UPI003F509F82